MSSVASPRSPALPRDNLALRHMLQRARAKRRVPVVASLELTLSCNLRCDHCYLGEDRKRDELSTDEVLRLLDDLAAAGTLLLTLTGGEVLLRRDFEVIYRRAHELGFLVNVFTNGLLIGPEHLASWREAPPRLIEISLYGLSDADYAEFAHREVSFARLDANLRALREAGLAVVLKAVATRTLAPRLPAFRAYAAELGFPFRFATVVYGAHDASPLADGERLGSDAICDLEEGTGGACDVDAAPGKAPHGERVFMCGAGRVTLHVDPTGVMSRCGMINTALAARVDLRETSVAEGWRRLGLGLEDDLDPAHPCRGCAIRTWCNRCPATSTPEQEIAMCDLAHTRARRQGLPVPQVLPMRAYWANKDAASAGASILKRRFRG